MTPDGPLVQAAKEALTHAEDARTQADRVLEDAERRIGERRDLSGRAGRRSVDRVTVYAWTPGQVAHWIGMSSGFVISEIKAKEIVASQFGREYRIARAEVRRYLEAKGFPLPDALIR